ncbi:MAG: hypothetical protein IJS32_04820 [Kiritimatiellae bacterium]|nr:hypothetical protein [Kiritimatiellia bacterium]
MKRPNSCVNLKKAIERLPAAGQDAVRLGRALANVVLGQMLPDGVVKGDGWDALYQRAIGDLGTREGILPTADEAVAWANDLIARIDTAP